MIGQCRRQDNIPSLAKLSVLVSKQDLLLVVAAIFATYDIILSVILSYPFVRIHGRKLVLHLIRLNNVLAVSGMVTGKDYLVWRRVKTGNVYY